MIRKSEDKKHIFSHDLDMEFANNADGNPKNPKKRRLTNQIFTNNWTNKTYIAQLSFCSSPETLFKSLKTITKLPYRGPYKLLKFEYLFHESLPAHPKQRNLKKATQLSNKMFGGKKIERAKLKTKFQGLNSHLLVEVYTRE